MSTHAQNYTSVDYPVAKSATAMGSAGVAKWLDAIGITSWGDAAAAIAFIYTAALFLEWAWKKVLRPLFERWGWIARKRRRKEDLTGD